MEIQAVTGEGKTKQKRRNARESKKGKQKGKAKRESKKGKQRGREEAALGQSDQSDRAAQEKKTPACSGY
ncbi:hypothetical protein KJ612_07685 [Myxococcota bacterium]|nr:hypothetical protein [Myxococcota bacterium]MBU1412725.1 hypothetical protein [Myxococcota bacterium]